MQDHAHAKHAPYRNLGIELAVDFLIMFFVMYTMIATVHHLLINVNNVYMTLMMVAPMAVVMLIGMRQMFPSKALNLAVAGIALAVFLASFAAMRTQAAIGDEQFLRSMIPHHSGAILMCEEAGFSAPEIVDLCARIVKSQREEIAEMEAILARL
jgi:uncharacterized protein (DUF305 family)